MTAAQYDQITEALNRNRRAIVESKRPEYTEGREDVLSNFKVVAEEIGISPIQVWYTYFRKHIMSIAQFGKNPDITMSEPISGRICDAINYLELLNALVEEGKDSQP